MRSGGNVLSLQIEPAPLVSLESFLSQSREVTLWRSPNEEWSFVGTGVAARLTASGPERFVHIQQQARELFSQLNITGEAPFSLRLFGGASFQDSPTLSSPWNEFASADFILPAWCYVRNQERAFVVSVQNAPKPLQMDCSVKPHSLGDDREESWNRLVRLALQSMQQGLLQKVVLSRCSRIEHGQPPSLSAAASVFASRYPSCAHFMMSRGAFTFLGATPEKLVSLQQQKINIDALAGSSPDLQNPEALLQNDKERREHQHVIDGIKNALAPISLSHAETPCIKKLPNVLHLHTPMQATLTTPKHILSLVNALHPTPAVCGSPKEAARRWINENEVHTRGWYAGPVGYFDANGEGSFYVAIRSALLHEKTSWIYSGAGLVQGSIPEKEFEETTAKQRPMREALGAI